MPLEFGRSDLLTFGVELELMVLNTRDYDLARGAADILPRLEKLKLPGEVKPEITESMIEINSSVHRRYDELLRELRTVRDAIVGTAERLNLAVAGGGSHPFHKWHERRIYPTERFRRVSSLYGYLAKQFTVFGQHVHVGVTSGDDAVYLTHRLAQYIRISSRCRPRAPISRARRTSFETSRLHAVSAFPLSGHMPPCEDWAEFNVYFDDMKGYGIVESMKDFYWDIRPKPEYGTIEVRISTRPSPSSAPPSSRPMCRPSPRTCCASGAPSPSPMYRVYGYNRFQACRFGFHATVIDPYTREQCRLADDVIATIERIAPDAAGWGRRRRWRTSPPRRRRDRTAAAGCARASPRRNRSTTW